MTREDLEAFILDAHSIEPDYPWLEHPNHATFRHARNKKWFALIMDVPRNKLGLPGTDILEIVNLKCDPVLLHFLWQEPGFFPAYHMNRNSWISVALDGSVPDEKIRELLEMSYDLTAPKERKPKP